MSEIGQMIRDHLDEIDSDGEGAYGPAGPLSAAIRDALDILDDDDPPLLVQFVAESVRLAVALRLGLIDSSRATAEIGTAAARLGLAASLTSGEVES